MTDRLVLASDPLLDWLGGAGGGDWREEEEENNQLPVLVRSCPLTFPPSASPSSQLKSLRASPVGTATPGAF